MTAGEPGNPGIGPHADPLANAPDTPGPVDTPPNEPRGLSEDRRERTRTDALRANAALAFADNHDEAERRFRRWRTEDPFPGIDSALLNAADLLDYIRAAAMIFPHGQPEDLKPASIQMHVEGPFRYMAAGSLKFGELRQGDDPDFDASKGHQTSLALAGDTIVFVTVRPFIRMPDYMAMRFNLKIDHVYKGLLLGTGPLVDPGFTGRLSIPLHNLTSKEYVLRAGDGLIWAEFTKLSKHRFFSAATNRSSEQAAAFPPLEAVGPRGLPEYIQEATGDGETPATSIPARLAEIRADFGTFKTNVESRTTVTDGLSAKATDDVRGLSRRLNGLSWAAAIGTVLAVFAIVVPTIVLVYEANNDNRSYDVQLQEQQREITDLRTQVSELRAALAKKTARP